MSRGDGAPATCKGGLSPDRLRPGGDRRANCRFLQGPDTDKDDVARIRLTVAARQKIEIAIYNYRKDGTPFLNQLLLAPVKDAHGEVA